MEHYVYSLPSLRVHTTNRIQRQLCSRKLSILETFGTTPDTVSAIIHLVKFTDNRLSEREIFSVTVFDNV